MKHFFTLLVAFATAIVSAQTNTFTGATDTDWNTAANWSLNLIPITTHDVVIPTGKTVTAYNTINVKSLHLVGTAAMTLATNINVAQTFNIDALSVLTWASGNFEGGTMNNTGMVNLVPAGSKQMLGGSVINNSGTITEDTDWVLDIVNGTVNNLASGTIELKATGTQIAASGTGSHLLNNAGTLKKTGGGNSYIQAELHNTGTIFVESGNMNLNNADTDLTGGVYNMAADGNLVWTSALQVSGTLTGNIAGQLNWSGTVNVPTTASFNFTGNGTFNWGNGHLGGGGTLNNNSNLMMTGAYFGNKYIDGGTTLNNAGSITIATDWALDIADGTLNNLSSGVIEFQFPHQLSGNGAGNHLFHNAGLIKKTGTSSASITARLENTGTISVDGGILNLTNPQTLLIGGIYNVANDAFLFWNETVTCLGILTGNVSGWINWVGALNVPTAASFNFTGSGTMNWGSGNLKGGGILTNLGTLTLSSGWQGNRTIIESTTLSNPATIVVSGDLAMMLDGGTIDNLASGTIDIQTAGGIMAGSGLHVLNNAGTIVKTASTGTYAIDAATNNLGTIRSSVGRISFGDLTNTITGMVTGTAEVGFTNASSLTNNGIFAPGGSPGILTVAGNFTSGSLARLAVELNGNAQGLQYDLLQVQGDAVFNGTVDITLGFAPNIGDTFTIANTGGTITSFGMATTASAVYNGLNYVFGVSLSADNRNLLLTLQSILADETFDAVDSKLVLAPNPASGFVVLKNDSGKTLTDLQLVDLNGRVIRSIEIRNNEQQIDLSGMASGSYLVRINADEASFAKRLIVR